MTEKQKKEQKNEQINKQKNKGTASKAKKTKN